MTEKSRAAFTCENAPNRDPIPNGSQHADFTLRLSFIQGSRSAPIVTPYEMNQERISKVSEFIAILPSVNIRSDFTHSSYTTSWDTTRFYV
jgi:hypothetical protein